MGNTSARDSADQLAVRVRTEVEPYVGRAREEVGELADRAAPHLARARDEVARGTGELVAAATPLVEHAVETVSGVLDDAGVRGAAAVLALRGERIGPPLGVRRWPWAVGAALAGAAAGAAVAYVVGRVRTSDAPEAVEPEQVQAVVDRPDGVPPAA